MARRGERSRDSRRYYDWIEAALQDRLAAELLLSDERLYESCAFHCQQCVEKSLKAYLLLRNGRLVDGHNLTWLCKQAVKLDERFTEWLDESAALNRYYIETRYPSDFPNDITARGVHRLVEMAQEMYEFICAEIDAAQDGRG